MNRKNQSKEPLYENGESFYLVLSIHCCHRSTFTFRPALRITAHIWRMHMRVPHAICESLPPSLSETKTREGKQQRRAKETAHIHTQTLQQWVVLAHRTQDIDHKQEMKKEECDAAMSIEPQEAKHDEKRTKRITTTLPPVSVSAPGFRPFTSASLFCILVQFLLTTLSLSSLNDLTPALSLGRPSTSKKPSLHTQWFLT